MTHGLDPAAIARRRPQRAPLVRLNGSFDAFNQFIVLISSIALVGAALVLTYSVIVRYFLHISTDWQDEMSVFLIIGAVFMSSAAIQARRGHVAIEAIVQHSAAAASIGCGRSWSISRA